MVWVGTTQFAICGLKSHHIFDGEMVYTYGIKCYPAYLYSSSTNK